MQVFIDLETRSRADIKDVGGNVYVRDDTTELLCGVAIVEGQVHLWSPYPAAPHWVVRDKDVAALGLDPAAFTWNTPVFTDAWFPPFLAALADAGATFVAHNGEGFDRPALEHHGFPDALWVDTMHRARQSGLPAGLNAVGEALFGLGKDTKGQKVLKTAMCPNKKGRFTDPDVARLSTIARYCARDVLLMVAAWEAEGWGEEHPDDDVRRVHVVMDRRGLPVDLALAQTLLDESERLKEVALCAVEALGVDRAVATSPVKIVEWLGANGVAVANAQKQTLQTALDSGVPPEAAVLIGARLACNRVTLGKSKAALATTCPDGRMRGTLAYWGAHTGRWAGRGFQTQNLTAPVKGFSAAAYGEDIPVVAASLDVEEEDILASMLRGIIVAEPGRALCMIDYEQIEARVLLWMAGDSEGLQVFHDGRDIYRVAAASIYGVAYDDVAKDSLERKVGKVSSLALGYQGGPGALGAMAANNGLNLDAEGIDPEEVVNAWRDGNTLLAGRRKGIWTTPEGKVVVTRQGGLWKEFQHAAKVAVLGGGPQEVGRCLFRMAGRHLEIVLPSGRPLVYRDAQWIQWENAFGGHSPALTFNGVRFGKACREATYGGRLVENCLAGDTKILTNAGWKRLDSLTGSDMLWDGEEWVSHDGLVDQGEQEVGLWLGVRATAEHLILAGKKWCAMTHLDAQSSTQSLSLGRASVPLSLLTKTAPTPSSVATAGTPSGRRYVPYCEGRTAVEPAPRNGLGLSEQVAKRTQAFSRHRRCFLLGHTDTLGLSLAAPTLGTRRGPTTEGAESSCTQSGAKIAWPSTSMPRPSTAGTKAGSTSTGSTTTGAMSRGTSDSSHGWRTPTIDGGTSSTTSRGSRSHTGSSASGSAPSGALTPRAGTLTRGEALSGLWRTTGRRERVYDVLNCGPRSRFMVLTSHGPVLAHNCCQAIARDVMADAMVALEAAGFPPLFTVHDEVISSVRGEEDKAAVIEIMCRTPKWAAGLPLKASGEVGERYGK